MLQRYTQIKDHVAGANESSSIIIELVTTERRGAVNDLRGTNVLKAPVMMNLGIIKGRSQLNWFHVSGTDYTNNRFSFKKEVYTV